MATITGITADRAAEIEDQSVVSGNIDSEGTLNLVTHAGTVLPVGTVSTSSSAGLKTCVPSLSGGPILPGRPLSAENTNFLAWAKSIVGTVFFLDQPADLHQLVMSVRVAGAAGSIGRLWVSTFDMTTGSSTLVRDFGTVSLESSAAEGIIITNPGATGDLPAGDYVICFVANVNIELRSKQVHDAPFGAQSGTGIFNLGNNRICSVVYKDEATFPSAAPLTPVILDAGVGYLNTTCVAPILPVFV